MESDSQKLFVRIFFSDIKTVMKVVMRADLARMAGFTREEREYDLRSHIAAGKNSMLVIQGG